MLLRMLAYLVLLQRGEEMHQHGQEKKKDSWTESICALKLHSRSTMPGMFYLVLGSPQSTEIKPAP